MNRVEKRIDFLYALKIRKLNDILQKYHLTYDDYQVIKVIHYMDGVSIETVVKESKLDPHIIRKISEELLQKGFIKIVDNKIFLGEKAKSLYPQIKKDLKKEERRLGEEISGEDITNIIEVLDQLIDYYEK